MAKWIGILTLFLLAWAQAATTTLTGTVVTGVHPKAEVRSGDPLAGVELEVQGTEFRTTSNANGFFAFSDLPDGHYTLVCRKAGYPEVRMSVRAFFGARCSVVMNPAGATFVGDLAVSPGTVYVAYSKRPENEAGIEYSPYSLLEQKKWAAGVRREQWAGYFRLPGMPRGMGQAHLINDVIGDSNFLMSCPPQAPGRSAFLPSQGAPLWLSFDSTGNFLYVALSGGILEIRDLKQGHKAVRNLPVGGFIADLQLSLDQKWLVLTSNQSVTLLDTTTQLPATRLPAPFQITSAALVGTRLFVCGGSSTSGQVVAIDTVSGREVGRCQVGHRPTHLRSTPDGSRLLVACAGSAGVSLVDTLDLKELQRIPTGNNPERLAISPDGSRCFVANKIDNTVSLIDLKANAVMAQVEVAREPSGLAFSGDGRHCFVACRKDGCLMILDGRKGELLHTTVPQPNAVPFGVAVRPPY
jgi:YVTN family beta-propeller protein